MLMTVAPSRRRSRTAAATTLSPPKSSAYAGSPRLVVTTVAERFSLPFRAIVLPGSSRDSSPCETLEQHRPACSDDGR